MAICSSPSRRATKSKALTGCLLIVPEAPTRSTHLLVEPERYADRPTPISRLRQRLPPASWSVDIDAGKIDGTVKDRVEHRGGQPTRVDVLLARVVGTDDLEAASARHRPVPEPRSRPRVVACEGCDRPERGLPRDGPQGNHDPDVAQECQLPDEKRLAGRPFEGRRLVGGRRAPNGGRDVRVAE